MPLKDPLKRIPKDEAVAALTGFVNAQEILQDRSTIEAIRWEDVILLM